LGKDIEQREKCGIQAFESVSLQEGGVIRLAADKTGYFQVKG